MQWAKCVAPVFARFQRFQLESAEQPPADFENDAGIVGHAIFRPGSGASHNLAKLSQEDGEFNWDNFAAWGSGASYLSPE